MNFFTRNGRLKLMSLLLSLLLWLVLHYSAHPVRPVVRARVTAVGARP